MTTRASHENSCFDVPSKGLVLGIYVDEEDPYDRGRLTQTGFKYNSRFANGRLLELLKMSGPCPQLGESRIFYNIDPIFSTVVITGLGSECLDFCASEVMDESKEAIRIAAAVGCRELQRLHTADVSVESFGHAESAAEGAALGIWTNHEFRTLAYPFESNIHLYDIEGGENDQMDWEIGLQKASAQNLTRQLQDTPANLLTPSMFAQNIVNILTRSGVNVEVKVKNWAESRQMSSYLAVAKGSCEPAIFLELSYFGAEYDERPIVLIGQGTTFDSGGLCKKRAVDQEYGRGDMTGAAVIVATCRAVASMKLPVNIRGLIPLCEHIMGAGAMKPGDVVKTMDGKCIEISDTDAEAPLVIVDALLYAKNFFPRFVIDVGTISQEICGVFGNEVSAVFTNSDDLWERMREASIHTGDRLWRLPLWDVFRKKIKAHPHVDMTNLGIGSGYTCKSAAILSEFVESTDWLHLDAYGVMVAKGGEASYLQDGMAGRPTRTLIEMIAKSTVDQKIDEK
ncbi:cytosol aminopeptidase-like [Phlebotomus argentipes]|uniref:cytosol aminopeptidase-like n=1 Tax=Phlebotomus argentipes TaxID=94469 RepID=UPI0028930C21|nr:cytosol aminopeptidase-like [Phlebotomus argentipes]